MQKRLRLTSSERFSQIHQGSRSWVNALLVLKALPHEGNETRFGIITTRRIGKAVVRNKVKRRLREVVRDIPVKPGWDIVLIARNRKGVHRFVELRMAVQSLLHKADLLMSTSRGKATIT
ncbi:ribonuclease P protein component [SAR202 cluster bacterium AD-804-J14_MRT_500m]|nr:ribonuclease P protein component [SAR202 cluster bacterium AD-804-J14_MRT_500m]